jgi:hypothetical protein
MKRNGCFDRAPLKSRVMVQDGWNQSGDTRTPRMVIIPDPMTKTCQYRLKLRGAKRPAGAPSSALD